MNDDIQTLREAIADAWSMADHEFAVGTDDHEALERERTNRLAALDRLEAEVERLRRDVQTLTTENDFLSSAIQQREGQIREGEAENERLRSENARLRAQDDKAWIAWHKRQHDNKGEK